MIDHENVAGIVVRAVPGQTRQAVEALEQAMTKSSPASPFEFHFMVDLYKRQYQNEQLVGILAPIATFLTVFISCLGLFGLALFMVEQKTKEIGVRKVLGASVTSIMVLLTKDFIRLVGIGFIIAVPIVWYGMNRWLENFAYRIEIGPGVFALAGITALAIALLTVSWQSTKAALANPVESLRSE